MLKRISSGNDKFTKKTKGTDNTEGQTLHQEVEQDETEAAVDGDDNGCDDEVSTGSEGVSEGVGEKRTRGRDRKTRHLKRVVLHFKLFRGYSRQRTERGTSKVLHHA